MSPWVRFLIYTFLLTWIVGIVLIIPLTGIENILGLPEDSISNLAAKYGPTMGGIATVFALRGKRGVPDLLKKGIRWRVGWQYYLFALAVPLILKLPVSALLDLEFTFNVWSFSMLQSCLAAFATHLFLGGGFGEEFGWRGVMLPLMERHYRLISSTLILAFFWALWHMPAFIFDDKGQTEPLLAFLVVVLAASFIMSWLYYQANQSVLILAIFHAMINASGKIFVFATSVEMQQIESDQFYWYEALALLFLAMIILIIYVRTFTKQPTSIIET